MNDLAILRIFLLMATLVVYSLACSDTPLPIDGNASDTGNTSKDCKDYCQINERTCLDKQTSVECTVNANGCLDFANPTRCSDDTVCSNGVCIDGDTDCNDECTPGDLPLCNVSGLRETCGDHDNTGCLTYGAPRTCEAGSFCDSQNGECTALECEDKCVEGEMQCELHRITTCKKDSHGCLSFVGSQECRTGKTCLEGKCNLVQTCTSECNDNDTTCSIDGAARICGDWNNDGCFEFSESIECATNEICRAGDCVSANLCEDQCLSGETICIGNKIATCADYNGDGCVEFDAPASCPAAGATCQMVATESICVASPQSGKVRINEIFYDPLGPDLRAQDGTQCKKGSTLCTSPTFIELTDPPGLSIAAYKLTMINGFSGKAYNTATLPEDARMDGRGFAVIAMDKADNFLSYAAPFYTNIYYILTSHAQDEDALQNSAGSIVLHDSSGKETDAVGYGAFSAEHLPNFQGQGQPAPRALSGRSLGRIPNRASTNNNAADFITYYPTPGLPNQDLIINEVYVNQPGANDGTETFVELAAPILGWEDLSLNNYVLRAVAGHNGSDYIYSGTLPGIILHGKNLNDTSSVDGYVVLCNKKAKQPLHSLCTVHYEGPPFYTGPDNLILEYQQNAVDAIGYGTFTPADTFVGEGRPAPYAFTDSGRSLARGQHSDPNSKLDSNDNSVDFHRASPTPGVSNPRP